jgi:TolB protein
MDVEGTNLRRVTFSGDYNDGAAWHPRQPLLAYSTRQGNSFNLATVDLVALESKVITSGEGSKESPCFSPDGRKLVFSWRRGPKADVFMVDLASGRLRQLTADAGSNSDPSWSPYMR